MILSTMILSIIFNCFLIICDSEAAAFTENPSMCGTRTRVKSAIILQSALFVSVTF